MHALDAVVDQLIVKPRGRRQPIPRYAQPFYLPIGAHQSHFACDERPRRSAPRM